MVRIRTLVESLQEGYEKAFENLDKKVENIENVDIINVKDNVIPEGYSFEQKEAAYVERIVYFREKEEIKGTPWRPSLDTDLMDFMAASQPPRNVQCTIEEAYAQGKRNIRELIEMPYGWFNSVGCGGKSWELLKKTLNRYGFKLYKKGYVIKD